MRSLSTEERGIFSRCLSRMAMTLNSSLSSCPAVAGNMRANGSFDILAAALCDFGSTRSGADPHLGAALSSVFSWAPQAARRGSAKPTPTGSGSASFVLQRSDEPLWTMAARLPADAAELLLTQAQKNGKIIDPSLAWKTLRGQLKHGRDPLSLLLLARLARASSSAEVESALSTIALGQMSGSSANSPNLPQFVELANHLCLAHADMSPPISPMALIGSAPSAEPSKTYSLLIPAPFITRSLREEPQHEASRALRFLNWLDACADMSAKQGLPDIGSQSLPNKRMESTYQSLAHALQKGLKHAELFEVISTHNFSVLHPSLAEAFDARKGHYSMLIATDATPTAQRLRKTL
jgi:hypothetical protein